MIRKQYIKEKVWPFLVSLGGGMVMLLAFFVPSIQDQWDRYQSRGVIEQYVQIGDDLCDEGKFTMAENAYQKAFELSGEQRLDIELMRLKANVNRINEAEEWNSKIPDDLEEVDFQLLLHLQKEKNQKYERIATLNSYGNFLVANQRYAEAIQNYELAMALDSADVLAYINLGNLFDGKGARSKAKEYYLKAIKIDNENGRAHYNLSLLLWESGKTREAITEMEQALKCDESDSVAVREYRKLVSEMKLDLK